MIKPSISVVIANYNGEKYLECCLKSVLSSSYKDFEVLIVDDGSRDKSVEIIESFVAKNKQIKLFKNGINLGASASRNKAIKKASGKIIVFLDNDTEVNQNWLEELIKPFEDNSVGAAQALLLDFKNRDLIQMAGGRLIPHTGWLGAYFVEKSYKKNKSRLIDREIVGISAALAVKKEVLNKIGGFDEMEAVTTEDLDLCWRVWIAGYKILLAHKSIVYHYSQDIKDRKYFEGSKNVYFHLSKNSLRSIIKNYQFENVVKYLFFSIFINFVRGILVVFSRHDFSALNGFFYSVDWIVKNYKNTIKARKKVQSTRIFSDEFLLKKVFISDDLVSIYNKYFRGIYIL